MLRLLPIQYSSAMATRDIKRLGWLRERRRNDVAPVEQALLDIRFTYHESADR